MTTHDPLTERTATITLNPRHIAAGHQVWWFHALYAYMRFVWRLTAWHAAYEWYQLRYRDRAALITGATLALSAVMCMVIL